MGAKDEAELKKLKALKDNEDMEDLLPQTVSRRTKNQNLKPLLLILGHLLDDDRVKDRDFSESLNYILKTGVNHLKMMINVSSEINALNRAGKTPKKIGIKAFTTLINFQQMFVQGVWEKTDPLVQLPYMDAEEIKRYRRLLKQHQIANGSIETFCRLTPEQRAALELFNGDKAKNAELEKAVKAMPLITCSQKVEVEGEKVMTKTDVITVEFTM